MAAIPIKESGPISQARLAQPVPPYSEVKLTGGADTVAPAPALLDLAHILAAGTLVTGGLLLLAGHRRAAAAVAAAGTAIVLLQEQEAVKEWWGSLPGHLARTQEFLDRVEGTLQEVSTQGHRLQSILRR